VVETVLKYGKLDIREDSPEKPYLLANVKDNRTTLNTDDVFENGFSLKLRDMLDPGKKDIKSLVKVGETRSEMEERRKQGGTSTDKPTPMVGVNCFVYHLTCHFRNAEFGCIGMGLCCLLGH